MNSLSLFIRRYIFARSIKREFDIGYIKLIYYFVFSRSNSINIKFKDGSNARLPLSKLGQLALLKQMGWDIVSVSDSHIKLRNLNGAIISCRLYEGFDFGHLIEIYEQKAYGSNFKDFNVIDVGASNADSSIYFAKNGAKKVLGFEPDKRSYDLAVENIKASSVEDKVDIFNKAVSNSTGITQLIIYDRNPNANSIDKENMVSIEDNTHRENVEAISLKDILKMFNSEAIGLLKMDCEGCEYKTLSALETKDFELINRIYLEYHKGLQNLPEILETNGFTCKAYGDKDRMGYIIAEKIGSVRRSVEP